MYDCSVASRDDFLPGKEEDQLAVIGDFDYCANIEENPLNFVKLYLKHEGRLSEWKYRHIYRYTYTVLGKGVKLGYGEPENLCNSDKLEEDIKARKNRTKKRFEALKKEYENIRICIPKSSKYTVDYCMAICQNLLHNDLNYITGLKTVHVLEVAFEKVREAYKKKDDLAGDIYYNAVSRCFQDISVIFSSISYMDTYTLNISQNGAVGPLAKLYFSTERMFKEIYDNLSITLDPIDRGSENRLELFLTVGASRDFCSSQYFWRFDPPKCLKLISLNLPNAAALPDIIPLMLHEAGHLNSKLKNEDWNRCLYRLFYNYTINFIRMSKKGEDSEFLINIEQQLDSFLEDEKFEITSEMPLYVLIKIWIDALESFFKSLSPETSHLFSELLNPEYCKLLSGVAHEVLADYVMVEYGSYIADEYIKILRDYFDDNMINPDHDIALTLRIASILGYFQSNYEEDNSPEAFVYWLNEFIQNDMGHYEFLMKFQSRINANIELVRPIIDYICTLHIDKTLPPKDNRKRSFFDRVTKNDENKIHEHLKLWFDFIRDHV